MGRAAEGRGGATREEERLKMASVESWDRFLAEAQIRMPQFVFDAADMLSELYGLPIRACIQREQLADDEPGRDKTWTLSEWREFLELGEATTLDFDAFLAEQVKPKGALFLLLTSKQMGTGLKLGDFELHEFSPSASARWRKLGGDNHWSWGEFRPLMVQ